ncbi:MAG: orotate phosphoribosyltransferase [Oscillospiraceae bacterium]|nr:orotate phosphoribosyltransferase [Oscillospiraceae bacterium]
MSEVVNLLFKTNALRVSPEDNPFWYTSGKLGPYFVNTHFLYGGEEKANDLLSIIDAEKDNIFDCPKIVFDEAMKTYNSDEDFKKLIGIMMDYINTNIDLSEITYISGGERRDWFFSIPIANLLGISHITIYKDLKTVVSDSEFTETKEVTDLDNAKVLHIADLITVASSYERAWVPAIKALNANMVSSVVVVDRLQGGEGILANLGVASHSLVNIDKDLFNKAEQQELITSKQKNMILDYIDEPDVAMKTFIQNHPDFLPSQLNSPNPKSAEKARLCIESKFYE